MNRVCRSVLLPLVVAGGLAVTGCRGAAEAPTVASAGGTPTTAPTADVVTAYVEGVRAYVACLRAEGLKVSDPDTKGRFEFEGDKRLNKADPKFRAAQMKCASLLPPVPKDLEERPVMTAEEIEKARQYAKCMRENGAPDFPDPGPDGYTSDDNDGRPDWNAETDAARRAMQTCQLTVYSRVAPTAAQG